MLLVQVEGFLEVARLGSVSRAAEALFVTQPTLTARLHSLERELGQRLFVRTRNGMRLTEAGRAFIPYAERALRALREGRQALGDVGNGTAGHLMIGAAPAVSTYLLPSVLERFVDRHPRVEVAVRTGHSESVLEMVLRDEVQLGIGRSLRHPEVELIPFHEEELVLVVAPEHPFAKLHRVRMADVGGQQLIMFDRTSSYYERGLGVALLPRTAIGRESGAGALRLVDIADAPPMRTTIVAMRRRDAGPPTPILAAFLELLPTAAPA